ncbi:AAA family ATPase [Dyadobacter sp. 32]|uniref:ATP-binding protein n=1 Tax=Dyadobacter sp. 32 TaxID=538966 RepID=UPI0011EFA1B2
MNSPFKFLDPFTLEDRDEFFGREAETQQLYREVLRTRLLLLYGLSGTGKTSLIQCGLAGEFDGPDWLPLWIRRQSDINISLNSSINQTLSTAAGTLSEQIRQLYKHFLRPVYLIFDQFEELFILGEEDERETFANTLRDIMEEDLPCTVIMVMREEYLGRLFPIEQVLPNLFDFRVRVEPMSAKNVRTVLRESFTRFNISVDGKDETDKSKRYEEIISKVSRERSSIELTDLQIYLDQFYTQDYERTYPKNTHSKSTRHPIVFTGVEIDAFGSIDEVLSRFMDEQEESIQLRLTKEFTTAANNTVKLVMNGFVSPEGTKRPIKYSRTGRLIKITTEQRGFFPALLAEPILSLCLTELERVKILRLEGDYMELRHDNLAQKIYNERTAEQRKKDNLKIIIKAAQETTQDAREYLSLNQLAVFEDVVPLLDLNEKAFFEESRKVRKAEAESRLEKERDHSNSLRVALNEKESARQDELVARLAAEQALKDAEAAKLKVDQALKDTEDAKQKVEKVLEDVEVAKSDTEIQASKTRYWLNVAIVAFIVTSITAFWANQLRKKALCAEKNAIIQKDSVNIEKEKSDKLRIESDKNLRQFQASEFQRYLLDAETFLKSVDTTDAKSALNFARKLNDTYFFEDSVAYRENQLKIEKIKNKGLIK